MNDVRVAGPARANFRAGRLASYAFSVEATIGQNPMRYLFARCFTGGPGQGHAVTALFVLNPEVLFGTYIWIVEDPALNSCKVNTFLPTMREPIQVVERLQFDCLPLTDIGYVDLMAWPHPALQPTGPDACSEPRSGEVSRIKTRCYIGPATLPGLHVTEMLTPRQGMVVARAINHGGQQVRRWETIEWGGANEDRLPRRIRVSRLQSGHRTDFVRTSEAISIPAEDFDTTPVLLREAIRRRLSEEQG